MLKARSSSTINPTFNSIRLSSARFRFVTYNSFVIRQFKSFDEFWPFYLGEHSKKATRAFHFGGTSLLLILVCASIAFRSPVFVAYGVASAYGLAWISHFFFERNRPATFRYPLFSLIGDFKMYFFIASGRMTGELSRLKIPIA